MAVGTEERQKPERNQIRRSPKRGEKAKVEEDGGGRAEVEADAGGSWRSPRGLHHSDPHPLGLRAVPGQCRVARALRCKRQDAGRRPT
eukprot:8219443-Pyramimonas_sp.AAC.1